MVMVLAIICNFAGYKFLNYKIVKTKGRKKEKVNIVTLGCSKNIVDSENILTQLRGNGISAAHENDENRSNIVIINTCGFIDSAKQESIDTILRYAGAREEGLIDKLYVTGCLSQRYREDLQKEIPIVDAYFGTNELPLLLKKFKANYKHELVGERVITTASHFAYLKISEGCDRPCSFCAIPLMRGKHVSRPMEELVQEARSLARRGVRELLLIAQDSTYYGLDLYEKRNLSELLLRLSAVDGIEWIRLHYAFPAGFPEDVLDVIASQPNICKYLDMPLQHASDKLLRTMRRGITKEKTQQLIDKVRERIPGIAIRTTIITGYPGETEKDFEELKAFVESNKFERLGVFTYSHEEGTHAYAQRDNVPARVKQERASELMAIQEQISHDLNQKKVGRVFKTIIDKKEGEFFVGRTEFDSPEVDNEVLIKAYDHYLRIGDFSDIKITGAAEFDLYGEVV
jgi:ribosomal protein S12 methylthiotransferase